MPNLRDDYVKLRPAHGIGPDEIAAIEYALQFRLSENMKSVLAFFDGGKVGALQFFRFSTRGDDSVVQRTLDYRRHGLDARYVVVAHSRHGVYLADTPSGAILGVPNESDHEWIEKLRDGSTDYKLTKWFPDFESCLRQQLNAVLYRDTRKELRRQFPHLVPARAKDWRHRWSAEETRRICDAIRAGRPRRFNAETIVVNGTDYLDLRGLVVPLATLFTDPTSGIRPKLERVDFSFSAGRFDDIEASDCRFLGSSIETAIRCRYVNCDFTMLDSVDASFNGVFINCSFVGAQLSLASLEGEFRGCDFSRADLTDASPLGRFSDCHWDGACFSEDSEDWMKQVYQR